MKYWCRRPSQRRISISYVLRRSCSRCNMPTSKSNVFGLACTFFLADPIFPEHCFLLRFPAANNNEVPFPASVHSRWRQGARHFQPQLLQRTTGWKRCSTFLSEGFRCIIRNTRGLVGSVFSRQRNREFKHEYLEKLFDNNNNLCVQEVHGKDEIFRRFRFWLQCVGFSVLLFLITKDRLSAVIGTFYLKRLL